MTQFNSHADNQDLVSDCKFLITGSYEGTLDYDIKDMTRSANSSLNDAVSRIMVADNRWEFDDENFETLPIGKTHIVSGQQDYEVSGGTFLNISEVAVKDSRGYWQVLTPVDRNKGKAQRLSSKEHDDNDGLPTHYDKMGNSILLYPKPASGKVTTNKGLRVVFQRPPSYFIPTDTTKEPGFPSTFHRLISIGMAIDYCIANGLSIKLEVLRREKQELDQQLIEYYTDRNKDEQLRMGVQSEDYNVW